MMYAVREGKSSKGQPEVASFVCIRKYESSSRESLVLDGDPLPSEIDRIGDPLLEGRASRNICFYPD